MTYKIAYNIANNNTDYNHAAKAERKIGASCLKNIYLDELKPNMGRKQDFIFDDCGIFCELMELRWIQYGT